MLFRLLVVAAVALLAACGGDDKAARPAGDARLVDLGGVDDLRERVNADAGAPRLVLLLSPT